MYHALSDFRAVSEGSKRWIGRVAFSVADESQEFFLFLSLSLLPFARIPPLLASRARGRAALSQLAPESDVDTTNAPCTPRASAHHRRPPPPLPLPSSGESGERRRSATPPSPTRHRSWSPTTFSGRPAGSASASEGVPRRRHGGCALGPGCCAVGAEPGSAGPWPARRGRCFGASFGREKRRGAFFFSKGVRCDDEGRALAANEGF